jgi:hypothetical protein
MPQPRKLPSSLETDPAKVNELLVGLPDVTVLGAVRHTDDAVALHIQTNVSVKGCRSCGSVNPGRSTMTPWRPYVRARPGGGSMRCSKSLGATRRRSARSVAVRLLAKPPMVPIEGSAADADDSQFHENS